MKALITGAAGFIGSNIAGLLLQEGHSVVVLDNLQSGYRTNLDLFPQIRFVEGDIRNSEAVEEAIAGCEVVFHLAASVGMNRVAHRTQASTVDVVQKGMRSPRCFRSRLCGTQ